MTEPSIRVAPTSIHLAQLMNVVAVRKVDVDSNANAIKILINNAIHTAQSRNETQTLELLRAIDGIGVGPEEIRRGIAKRLQHAALAANPSRRVADLTKAVRDKWVLIWRHAGNVEPHTEVPVVQEQRSDLGVGDLILINHDIPIACGIDPGTIATVVGVDDGARVTIKTDDRIRYNVPKRSCVPCRGRVREFSNLRLVHWLEEKVATTAVERERNFCCQVAEALSAQKVQGPEHLDSLDEVTIRAAFANCDAAILNMIIKAAEVARSAKEAARGTRRLPARSVEEAIHVAKRSRIEPAEAILSIHNSNATDLKPADAGRAVATNFSSYGEARAWFSRATETLRNNRLRDQTIESYASALRAWGAFVDQLALLKGSRIDHIPASPEHVVWWMATFRHPGTAANYLTALTRAHEWAGFQPTWDSKICKQVVAGHVRIQPPFLRPRLRLGRKEVKRMAEFFRTSNDREMADLCVIGYSGGFRVKSELLPSTVRSEHSSWEISESRAVRCTLRTRKNRSEESYIVRNCECNINPVMCPHRAVLSRLRSARSRNSQFLFTFSYAQATARLRQCIDTLNIGVGKDFSFHCLRRGLAHDLLTAKTPLRDVLAACDWRSSTFAWYMCREEINSAAILEAAFALSDEE